MEDMGIARIWKTRFGLTSSRLGEERFPANPFWLRQAGYHSDMVK